jgi:hypothetical protein
LYRARQYDRAAANLERAISILHQRSVSDTRILVFLAMANHHLKSPNAPGQLNRATREAGGPSEDWWPSRIETRHLVKEAERELSQTVK